MGEEMLAELAVRIIDYIITMIDSGKISDSDLARIAESVARRKKAVAAWDAEAPEE